jgi:hypothetical protein
MMTMYTLGPQVKRKDFQEWHPERNNCHRKCRMLLLGHHVLWNGDQPREFNRTLLPMDALKIMFQLS